MILSGLYLFLFFIFCFLSLIFLIKHIASFRKSAGVSNNKNKKNFNVLLPSVLVFITVAFLLNIIFSLIAVSVFLYIHWIYRTYRKNLYKNRLNKQLLETVRLFKNAVISGQSCVQAFDSVSVQISEPLSSEFKKICSDVNLGMNLDNAVKSSIDRICDDQYRIFLDSVRISNSTGAGLSDIIGKIENTISDKMSVYSKLNALTAQAKISGTVISLVPVIIVLFVLVSEPAMMSVLFTDILGNIVLFISVIMILSGSFFMKKISEVDI